MQWSSSTAFDDEKNIQILAKGSNSRTDYSIAVNFTIPEAKYGTNYIRLIRYGADDVLTYQFTVKPKLELSPAEVAPGSKVTLKCTGFPSDAGGTITFDGKPTNIEIVPNAKGTFTGDFTMPVTLAGEHKFVANSPKVFTDVMTATVKVVPVVTIEPLQPDVGTEVKISGSGFAAKSPLKLKFDNVNITNSPTTDDNGSFTYSFKVPETNTKDHKITVEDGAGYSAVWGLKLENTPPPKPTPVAPRNERFGWFGDQSVTFAWSPVSDPSGVTYTIEVAEDLNFFPLKPGMKKTGLTQTNCTLSIMTGAYYWRVRAVDGAGNEGEWAISPFPFYVGFFSTWMIVGGGILCLLAFAFLIRAFFKRLREYY